MRISLTVPGILKDCIGGERTTQFEASTLGEAIASMRTLYPLLNPHLYDESGHLRRHVLLYYNDESVTWIEDWNSVTLKEGDRLQVIQAVSGGRF